MRGTTAIAGRWIAFAFAIGALLRYLPPPTPAAAPSASAPGTSPQRAATTNPSTNPSTAPSPADVSDRVHIFYYNWYGAPPQQRAFVHWQQGGHAPPHDIGSNYYPLLGAYSSSDPAVLRQHMTWIRRAGVGVVSLTWWGQGSYEDGNARAVLDAAAAAGLKVNFHLEPYDGFSPDRFAADIRYLLDRYGSHPAFYRAASLDGRAMFYVFNALKYPAASWRRAIDSLGPLRDRLSLIAQTSDLRFITDAGFDGGYVYDGLAPFKDPHILASWPQVAAEFRSAGKLFIPSVGPGYWDDRAVPRGADEPDAARTRDGGNATTYDAAWKAAIAADTPFVTITSFNEWHEGSQIEPAAAKKIDGYEYPAYRDGEVQYLDRTARWTSEFARRRSAP